MHLLLTDRLSCPRCGPGFGLILLANQLVERRVNEGVLGCPNCRDSFPVRAGFADLRAPPRGDLPEGVVGPPPTEGEQRSWGGADEESERLLALLGIHRGPGTVALVGEPARHAAALAAGIEDILLVGVDPDLAAWPDAPGVSRIAAAPGLPFFSGMLRGVCADGRLGETGVREAARVLGHGSRIVVTHAPEGAESWIEDASLKILASEDETVVATRG